jgi:hypothetical protein
LSWPSNALVVFDVEECLEPFLKARGVKYEKLGLRAEQPVVIVVTPFTALWRQPEEYRNFFQLFSAVERGCAAVFLGLPSDGPGLTAANLSSINLLTPLTIDAIFPFHQISAARQVWEKERIGPYSWGLTDPMTGVPIVSHPIFEGLPNRGLMGREYGNVVPVERIGTDWLTSENTGTAVQIYRHGRGKIILTSFNLLPNLKRDALAEKLLCNLVNYAAKGLPSELGPENPVTAESLAFQEQGYEDCFEKYIARGLLGKT